MLHIQIDPHSGIPVYRQIMDQVKYYLASSLLKPGDQLPSIRVLAKTLTVNPTTIVKAYSELEHEKIIEMRRGKGAFIAARSGKVNAIEAEKVLKRSVRQLITEANQLRVSKDQLLSLVEQELKCIEGKVF